MSRFVRSRAAMMACLLLLGACLWRDAVTEGRPVEAPRPADEEPIDEVGTASAAPPEVGRAEAERPQPSNPLPAAPIEAPKEPAAEASPEVDATISTEPGPASEPEVGIAPLPTPIGGPQDGAPKAEVVMLPGGLMLVAPREFAGYVGGTAMLRLTLPVGTRAGKPGLAELTAHVVADLRLPARPGGSLRGALARLSASLDVHVAAASTSFEVVFPQSRHRDVLSTLAAHLAQPLDPAVPSETFETLRVRLASRLARTWTRAPLLAMVERMRTGRARALAEIISEINLRTAAEVAVFQRAHYRAAGAMMAMWVPGVTRAELGMGAVAALVPWLDINKAEAAMPLLTPTPLQEGVFWAPREGPVDVGVFVPQPSLDQPFAAEMLVLQECLTHDGLGGRLGLAIEGLVGRDVAFDVLPAGETDQFVLLARAQDEIVVPLWEAVSQVLDSFRTRPPADAELRAAAARARMRLLAQVGKPNEWLRMVSRLAFRRSTPDAFDAALAKLATPARLDLAAAIPLFCSTPLALAVVGGRPPVDSSRIVQLVTDAVVPSEKIEQLLPPDELAARRAEAARCLATVAEALGGEKELTALRGYREVVVSEVGVGPTVETETWFRSSGQLRATTKVLATTITTRISGDEGSEVSGNQRVSIPVDEVRTRLATAARHPLVVIARWVRGEIAFRVVALRMVAGREQAVLEEITGGADSLRLTIDTRASLVRAMEARTWHPEVGALVVREEFFDYRTVGGRLRAPFLRTRSLDESEPSHRLRTLAFDPSEPTDDAMK